MKAIMISIKPEWCTKILNGEKTIEVRKNKALANAIQKLIDEHGYADIYVYCTKEADLVHFKYGDGSYQSFKTQKDWDNSNYNPNDIALYNGKGKVVFKFRCYKVEDIKYQIGVPFPYLIEDEKLNRMCLTYEELEDYLFPRNGYAIHISNLEIFDRPKELYEFKTPENAKRYKADLDKAYDEDQETLDRIYCGMANDDECANAVELTQMTEGYYGLQKAPQNFVYVEVE